MKKRNAFTLSLLLLGSQLLLGSHQVLISKAGNNNLTQQASEAKDKPSELSAHHELAAVIASFLGGYLAVNMETGTTKIINKYALALPIAAISHNTYQLYQSNAPQAKKACRGITSLCSIIGGFVLGAALKVELSDMKSRI